MSMNALPTDAPLCPAISAKAAYTKPMRPLIVATNETICMNCVVRRLEASRRKCGMRISNFFKRKNKNAKTGTVTSNIAAGNANALKLALPFTRIKSAAINPIALKNNDNARNTYSTPNGLSTLTTACDCVALSNGELLWGVGVPNGGVGGVDATGALKFGVGSGVTDEND